MAITAQQSVVLSAPSEMFVPQVTFLNIFRQFHTQRLWLLVKSRIKISVQTNRRYERLVRVQKTQLFNSRLASTVLLFLILPLIFRGPLGAPYFEKPPFKDAFCLCDVFTAHENKTICVCVNEWWSCNCDCLLFLTCSQHSDRKPFICSSILIPQKTGYENALLGDQPWNDYIK